MTRTTEQTTVLTVEEKTARVNVSNNKNSEQDFDEKFPIVRASTLSLEEAFMRHEPQSNQQLRLKNSITLGIKEGLKDFRCAIMDPTFDESGNYVYQKGKKPAVGKSARYGKDKLKEFMPEKNSRMGTGKEHDAFLGILIRYLIEVEGYNVADAWKAVCNDSKHLGHYKNSENAKGELETTGNRKIGSFYDLGNTCKIVEHENYKVGFALICAYYGGYSDDYPLSVLEPFGPDDEIKFGVPWLVLDV